MPKYKVKITPKPIEWVVEADNHYDALAVARDNYIDEMLEDFNSDTFSHQEIEEIAVREDRLHETIATWVETFNDCACCPCQHNCPFYINEEGIEPDRCADVIIDQHLMTEVDYS